MSDTAWGVLERARPAAVWRVRLGLGLSILSVGAACLVASYRETPISINRPVIPALGALFLLWPFRAEGAATLQRIICLYLTAIPVNQLSHQYLHLAGGVRLSLSVPLVLLALLGWWGLGSAAAVPSREWTPLRFAWVLAIGILLAHMVGLLGMLERFYGYGYEHDAGVLGNVALVSLVFFTLWPCLRYARTRPLLGVILGLYYVSMVLSLRQS
jgi:hypothetical protein